MIALLRQSSNLIPDHYANISLDHVSGVDRLGIHPWSFHSGGEKQAVSQELCAH